MVSRREKALRKYEADRRHREALHKEEPKRAAPMLDPLGSAHNDDAEVSPYFGLAEAPPVEKLEGLLGSVADYPFDGMETALRRAIAVLKSKMGVRDAEWRMAAMDAGRIALRLMVLRRDADLRNMLDDAEPGWALPNKNAPRVEPGLATVIVSNAALWVAMALQHAYAKPEEVVQILSGSPSIAMVWDANMQMAAYTLSRSANPYHQGLLKSLEYVARNDNAWYGYYETNRAPQEKPEAPQPQVVRKVQAPVLVPGGSLDELA